MALLYAADTGSHALFEIPGIITAVVSANRVSPLPSLSHKLQELTALLLKRGLRPIGMSCVKVSGNRGGEESARSVGNCDSTIAKQTTSRRMRHSCTVCRAAVVRLRPAKYGGSHELLEQYKHCQHARTLRGNYDAGGLRCSLVKKGNHHQTDIIAATVAAAAGNTTTPVPPP